MSKGLQISYNFWKVAAQNTQIVGLSWPPDCIGASLKIKTVQWNNPVLFTKATSGNGLGGWFPWDPPLLNERDGTSSYLCPGTPIRWGPHHWSDWTEEVDGCGNSDASGWLILVPKGERTMPRFSDSTTFRDLSTSRWVLGRWRCGTMGTGSDSEVFALSWTHTRKFILLLWTTESGLSWWYSFSRKCGQNQLGWDSFIARDIWFQSDSWKYQDKALDLRRWCHGSFWPWPRDHHCLRKETQSLCPVTSSCFWRNAQKSAKKKGGMDGCGMEWF